MTRKVTVYSKDNCMQCKFVKKWLDDEEIPFTEIRADLDPEALRYVKEDLGFQALPVTIIEGEIPFYGFRPNRLEALIRDRI